MMRKITAVLLVLIISAIPQSAFAASLNLNAECSNSIAAGESFTVNIKYSSDYLDTAKATLSYDADLLEYVSGGSSSGDGGIVSLKDSSADGRSIEFAIKFKALAAGTTSVAVSTEEAYDLDGKAMNTPHITKNITIEASAPGEPSDNTKTPDNSEIDSDGSDNSSTAADKKTDTQTQRNSRLLIITIAATAVIFAAVCIIAAVTKKKKRQKNI